jgi:hypothetical protein
MPHLICQLLLDLDTQQCAKAGIRVKSADNQQLIVLARYRENARAQLHLLHLCESSCWLGLHVMGGRGKGRQYIRHAWKAGAHTLSLASIHSHSRVVEAGMPRFSSSEYRVRCIGSVSCPPPLLQNHELELVWRVSESGR